MNAFNKVGSHSLVSSTNIYEPREKGCSDEIEHQKSQAKSHFSPCATATFFVNSSANPVDSFQEMEQNIISTALVSALTNSRPRRNPKRVLHFDEDEQSQERVATTVMRRLSSEKPESYHKQSRIMQHIISKWRDQYNFDIEKGEPLEEGPLQWKEVPRS